MNIRRRPFLQLIAQRRPCLVHNRAVGADHRVRSLDRFAMLTEFQSHRIKGFVQILHISTPERAIPVHFTVVLPHQHTNAYRPLFPHPQQRYVPEFPSRCHRILDSVIRLLHVRSLTTTFPYCSRPVMSIVTPSRHFEKRFHRHRLHEATQLILVPPAFARWVLDLIVEDADVHRSRNRADDALFDPSFYGE